MEKDMLKGAEVAARALGVRIQFVEVRGPEDFDFLGHDQRGRGWSDYAAKLNTLQ